MTFPLESDTITTVLLVVFLFSVFGVFLIIAWLIQKGPVSKKEKRIAQYVVPDDPQGEVAVDRKLISDQEIGKLRGGINKSLGGLSNDKLKVRLSSAYWKITDTEFVLMRYAGMVLAFFLGWLFFDSILGGLMPAIVVYMLPQFLLDRAIARRQKKFQNQLLDVLVLIKGSVQAGYSLMQALDLAVREIPAPASEEFARVLYEIRLGLSLEDALFNLAERMESDDLQIVVTAIIINAQVGGNLSMVLESTVNTIRDRIQLFAEVRTLTSYSKYVGNFLSFLPFVFALLVFFASPGYFDNVQTSLLTQIIFVMAIIGIIIGNIWIRRLSNFKV